MPVILMLSSIKMQAQLLLVLVAMSLLLISDTQSTSNDGSFLYSRGAIPDTFHLGTRYPDRNETEECRPLRLRIVRSSRLYRTQLVTNINPYIIFHSADARVMTARMQSRLNALASSYWQQFSAKITVLRSWVDYTANDTTTDPNSLHYEGKCINALLMYLWKKLTWCQFLCTADPRESVVAS